MPPTKRNNNWKWFFALLIAATLFTSIFLIVYNLRQQLKPEQLEAARKKWEQSGPANYTMIYTTRKNEETSTDHYVVKVRGKKTHEVLVNGLPLTTGIDYYGMDRLFDDVEKFIELDGEKGKPRTYMRATFDEKTGAIRWYVRRVMGSRERLEILVEALDAK